MLKSTIYNSQEFVQPLRFSLVIKLTTNSHDIKGSNFQDIDTQSLTDQR